MEAMTRAAAVNAYVELLGDVPRVIRTEEQNEHYTAVLEDLLRKKHRTADEEDMVELLTLLIENFEEDHYALPPALQASPIDIIKHLMDANHLRQVDMVGVFGSRGIASEVLNGKRALSKAHIQRLSQRFHVSPELFLETGNWAASANEAQQRKPRKAAAKGRKKAIVKSAHNAFTGFQRRRRSRHRRTRRSTGTAV
jgi:HTH-type transcriptional regulator / antitoxin HigA